MIGKATDKVCIVLLLVMSKVMSLTRIPKERASIVEKFFITEYEGTDAERKKKSPLVSGFKELLACPGRLKGP